MLREGGLNAVAIASPHSRHAEHVRAAVAAGLSVFVEKPLALDGWTAQELVDLSAAAGTVRAVGFNRRFRRAYRTMRGVARSGELGRLLHVEGSFSGPFGFGYTPEAWHARPEETPAGGLTLMGVHVIDCMIGLLGPVSEVGARSRRQHLAVDLDDTTDVRLGFASGAIGYISTLTATGSHWRLRLQVFGTSGWAQMIDQNSLTIATADGTRSYEFPDADAERAELEAFAAAASYPASPYPVPLEDVVNGIKVLTAAVRSVGDGGATVDVE